MTGRTDVPFTLVFLGCGWATRIHAKVLAAFAGQAACRFASRDGVKARAYNARFRGSGVYDSYESAITDPSVDVVVVATPPTQHLALAVRALRAGKDVIVEKPPFLRAADFLGVRRVCDETGRRVLVAENYFYKPLLRTLRRLLSDGVVGRPLFLQVNALRHQRISGWREDPVEAGRGALFEGGIHWINFLGNLGLSIESVQGFEPAGNGQPDRSMLVVVEYGEGPVATLHYSWEVPSFFRGLRLSRICGTAGSITFETNGLFVVVHGPRRRFLVPSLHDVGGYRAMWRDFLRALRTGDAPDLTLDLAERDLKLVESIYATLS